MVDELKNKIDIHKRSTTIRSEVINDLNYRLLWGSGILTTERSYDPYNHALNFHKIVFNYANKFVKESETIIVLVLFPWYNGIVSDFNNSNIKFYRAMARRVFCQYLHDSTPFKKFNTSFNGSETIHDVSKHLSGIIFLEDNTILSTEPDKTNVMSYVYTNPNAYNALEGSLAEDFLRSLHNREYDNFLYDNY